MCYFLGLTFCLGNGQSWLGNLDGLHTSRVEMEALDPPPTTPPLLQLSGQEHTMQDSVTDENQSRGTRQESQRDSSRELSFPRARPSQDDVVRDQIPI